MKMKKGKKEFIFDTKIETSRDVLFTVKIDTKSTMIKPICENIFNIQCDDGGDIQGLQNHMHTAY
jgi:hypothetical protein